MYRPRKIETNIRQSWKTRKVEYESDLTCEQLQKYGGSDTEGYGRGGRWHDDIYYISIAGNKSKGGMPFKLKTGDNEYIPISKTDCEKLLRLKVIRPVAKRRIHD